MKTREEIRLAWLIPSVKGGYYWQPFFKEVTNLFPQMVLFTGYWSGFLKRFQDSFTVKIVGESQQILSEKHSETGYTSSFIYASPAIILDLLKFKPDVVFSSYFSIWTLLALLFKPVGNWKVVIFYDGSSPTVDAVNSKVRLYSRRLMSRFTDAFLTNNRGGKSYLVNHLNVKESCIFIQPYQVADIQTLCENYDKKLTQLQLKSPIFLFVGQVIPRKGVKNLLDACILLKKQGYQNYTLLMVGDGEQKEELKTYSQEAGLEQIVQWVGQVKYNQLGTYFQQSDVFVLPTLEDVWAVVVSEAMAFGKPVLCSKWAGAYELVREGENGYVFDPNQPEDLAVAMRDFITNHPNLTETMGKKSVEFISEYTPQKAAEVVAQIVSFVFDQKLN
ncbi:glycosyltransferase family 4 protein [Capilliphycus salinus ALCB114379]|uniref:glycosyltransferase family 4 protein n=1 Tax=Capilliphycus salinus TaxID=2768948 RepID=UPI0039A558FC